MRKTVRIILLFSTICLFLIGYIYTHFNIMFTATMMLLVNNIFYSLESIRRRFVFLFFNISFFTFLMGQDLFEMINGQTWWASFPSSIMEHTLLVLFISLLSLYIGSVIMEKLNKKNKSNDYKPKKSIAGIRKTSKILFYLTFIVAFIVLLERVLNGLFGFGQNAKEFVLENKNSKEQARKIVDMINSEMNNENEY